MKTETRKWAGILFAIMWALLGFVIVPQSRAETGATNIIDGTTTSIPGSYMVGTNGAFNALIITNAGYFDVTGYSYVGNSATSSNNTATVTGTGSFWNNRSDLYLGYTGSFNQLTIANGGEVRVNGVALMGVVAGANSNSILVTGAGSILDTRSYFNVGLLGAGNQMIIANSGKVFGVDGYIAFDSGASNNSVLVTGAGSVWSNSGFVSVGLRGGQGNQLTITNKGAVLCAWGQIGVQSSFNSALVSGTGSIWNSASRLDVGSEGDMNQLMINDGGTVAATNVVIGANASFGNQISVAGGNLYATNATSTGALDVRSGAFTLNSGTVIVNRLYLTNNASSVMNFSAGLLRSGGSTVSNGVAFTVGDGSQSATLDLLGGDHSFANGLKLSTNGNLIGNGNIIGSATNFGVIAPGHSVGTINITGDLTLADSSWLDMELAGPGTNDVLDISGLLAAGGGLKLTLTNGYTGNAGDTFDLFNFGSISGAFSQTNLPTLAAGMEWNTGHLYTLGEIRIVPEPGTGALLALGISAVAMRRRKR